MRDSFQELLSRLRVGDQQAADEVFQRYARRLIGLAQSRLAARIRQKVDPEDVLQSVFRSFFCRHRDGQYELATWESLWSLLVVITLHKCGHQVDRFLAARRSADREIAGGQEDDQDWNAIDREPTPEEAVMLSDTVEHLMRSLAPTEQKMLTLRLQGCSVAEISEETRRSERTVERLLQKLRRELVNLDRERSSDS